MNKYIFNLLILFSVVVFGQTEKQVLDLSGTSWKMEGTLPGEGVVKEFHKYFPDANKVSVPGDVYTDLWRNSRIDDMNVGFNSQRAKWVMDYEWWYFRNFDIPKEMEGQQIHLYFEGVDYACDVYVNGELLGSHEGMFSHFSFNITDLVKLSNERNPKDNNFLAIRLHPAPRSRALVNGKKYRWHGDYNQNITPFGIWQPVKIIATGEVRVKDLYAQTLQVEDNSAELNVEIELINDAQESKEVTTELVIQGKNFESEPITKEVNQVLQPGVNLVKTVVDVPDAQLWYPWDLGDQNLYIVHATVKQNNTFQDAIQISFGIREVKLEMNPGWTLEEVEHPWTVMVNGKRHFIRSGTWGGPPDMFTGRSTEDTYRELIRLAKEANINNLRIFNWHPPEIPLFYELCSEAGISVWQDIAPINNPILHKGDEYIQGMYDEAVEILKQRRNWPCNVIIEGSEEILFMSSMDQREYQLGIVDSLGQILKNYTDLHYVSTSPLSSHHATDLGFKHHETAHPHGVHYGVGQVFMEDYYPKQNYAAIPELAVTSCPSAESIRKFIPEEDVWPPGPTWGYHWADLDVLQAHNFEVFGEDFTDGTLEEFATATQIAQGVYFQYAFELYRTRKPKMSAINFCHFILNTPDFKWATVDYYLQPKESHYYIQRSFQPLLVTLQYEKRRWNPDEEFKAKLWVVNDFMESYQNCKVNLVVKNNKKKVVKKKEFSIDEMAGDSAQEFLDIAFDVPGKLGDTFYVEVILQDTSGKELSANEYFLLVADQEEALKIYQKYGKAYGERIRKYGYATNRYFPGYWDNNKSLKVEWIDVNETEQAKEKNKTYGVVED